MHFRKDINGLRAIGVIAVVLFHFKASWMPGGFAGVDVFFVISGFLMTGIIFRGIEQKNFSILKFYVARANRIIPELALLCIVLLIFGWFYLTPLAYKALAEHVGSSMKFLSNILYWRESGYFDAASHEKWLLHTWSLSAEWQFYIIYPLVLIVMSKFMTSKTIKLTVLLGAVLGFIFGVLATYKWPTPAYYLLPTRAWEMMIGGVAYFFPFAIQQERKKLLEWVGLSLILCSYFFISKENPWPGYLALFPVLGSFLVIQAQRNDSLITNNVVFQKLGTWSYSIYLWHWPLVVAIYYFYLNESFIYIGIILSVFLGFVSNKSIKKIKFTNDFGDFFEYLKCKPVYMILVLVFLSSCIFSNGGNNGWLVKQDSLTKQTYTIIAGHSAKTGNWGANANGKQDFTLCRFNVQKLTETIEKRLKKCASNHGKGVLVLGDSHAMDLFGMIASKFDDAFIVGLTSVQGCRPHTPKKHCQYEPLKEFLSVNNNVFKHIIYEQGGFYLLRDAQGNKGSRNMFSKLRLSDSVEGISIDTVNVNKVAKYLSEISEFAPVTWFGSRIEPHFTNLQILNKGCDHKFMLRKNQNIPFDLLDEYIKVNIQANEKVSFLSQNKIVNYVFPQDFMNCDNKFWDDGDHLSSSGEELFGKRLPTNFLVY